MINRVLDLRRGYRYVCNFMICNETFFDIIKTSRKEGKSVIFQV